MVSKLCFVALVDVDLITSWYGYSISLINKTKRWLWKIGSERVGSTKAAGRLWYWLIGRLWYWLIGFFPACYAIPLFVYYRQWLTITSADGRHGGNHVQGGFNQHGREHGRDYHRKRHREDDHRGPPISKRSSDHESRRNPDPDSRPEKNPRFRESGDSDDDEEDVHKSRS
ncbi:hypothetical protein RHMOL_Rhmol05G0095300 [Rhododendron molle]|uniref:Uncharacterized protein n=1 Tax=Rhododendron molle TaxID=49168 RepID=A0ACC0NNL7_RHOML|nr:hypothetical protein RHMOL_Rhmol05G0095300 [Rhododendron molle]